MSEQGTTKDQLFKRQDELLLNFGKAWGDQLIAFVNSSGVQITVEECDLDVEKAKRLRDWLNEVLP